MPTFKNKKSGGWGRGGGGSGLGITQPFANKQKEMTKRQMSDQSHTVYLSRISYNSFGIQTIMQYKLRLNSSQNMGKRKQQKQFSPNRMGKKDEYEH